MGSGSLLWGKLSVLWVGTPGTVFPVERVGHRDANRGEAGLLPIQSSRNGTGSTRSLSKSEHRRSIPSRWKTVGPDRGATAEWRPQQPTGEHGLNPILVMPFGQKASLPVRVTQSPLQDVQKHRVA